MKFNEDSRVKIPSILHLCRLGYKYISLKDSKWDVDTNIFTDIFKQSVIKINEDFDDEQADRLLQDTSLLLDNEDLGKAFYKKLISNSGVKLIDFENFENNTFNVVTELPYKNKDEEFRPDIILLINGMPLAFIEVKKPNNRDGIIAERERINRRFQNKKFRKFVNITQLMVFSNNMEYDSEDIEPLQGAFYASPSYKKPTFNYFREDETLDLSEILIDENDQLEDFVLKDNNLTVIKNSPEFQTNKDTNTPTNRVSTSLFSKDRLAFILKYAIAYVDENNGIEKHVMRYPQMFGTKAIESKLDSGIKKGIIWHTQGSGKTALAYYNVRYLTDYFQKKRVIPQFYFIVDRLDLLIQAKREFVSRGLKVQIVNSRNEFTRKIKTTTAIHGDSGEPEITVVNIQKFQDDAQVVTQQDYDINIQRIYFLDEVHRSYNPRGSFLANLTQSDPNSIKIGLTGTPLITKDFYSTALFGDYIHKYYYNASIADGYTLKLIREEIESDYKIVLKEALEKIKVLQGEIEKKKVFAHPTFVEPMLDYIVNDFENSRLTFSDDTIGGMVVCDTSDQAREMYKIFNDKYANKERELKKYPMAIEPKESYSQKLKGSYKVKTSALILHDEGTKDDRKQMVEDFKEGKIDFLFVYNMLLTGFDAKRLKKLYIGRVIKRHNLLQTLTRVNRPFKNFRYGYVVDFADIKAEFDATNKAYFDELKAEHGDEMDVSSLFLSKEEIEKEIFNIRDSLLHYDTENAELFSQQISEIRDRNIVLKIKNALANAKSLYNLIRLFGHYDLLDKVDFKKLSQLYTESENHLALLNTKEALESNIDNTNLLNVALEDVLFHFTKVSEEELILADELKDTLRKTRETLANNFDKNDPNFISLYEELKRLFDKKNLDEITQGEMKKNIGVLQKIYEKVKELNRQNNLLKAKYKSDPKYARIHKRLVESKSISEKESKIIDALQLVKQNADLQVLQNTNLLKNESYFNSQMMQLVIEQFHNKNKIKLNAESSQYINNLVVNEYMNEFYGVAV
jgi:type I restriction enzyme, R subunit